MFTRKPKPIDPGTLAGRSLAGPQFGEVAGNAMAHNARMAAERGPVDPVHILGVEQSCTHEAWEQHGAARRCADCREPLPNAEPAEPADTTPTDIRDALAFNEDANSPALYCLRDALVTMPGATAAGALDAARILLAAHARELAAAEHLRTREVGASMRKRGDRSRVAYCGGMQSVINSLDRYADDLDEQAARGESQ
jgi:hypothetical protein